MKMKKAFLTFLIFSLLLIPGCRKDENSSSSDSSGIDILGTSDQTKEAVDLIDSANKDLKRIKEIYKANENGVQLLTEAMNQKDEAKVTQIADDLVTRINEGMNLATKAIDKIEEVQSLNVNDTFKEYLRLKEQALKKQLEAFDLRRQAGVKIVEAYGEKDKLKISLTKAELTEREEKFKVLMSEARDLSTQANKIYKESFQQKSAEN